MAQRHLGFSKLDPAPPLPKDLVTQIIFGITRQSVFHLGTTNLSSMIRMETVFAATMVLVNTLSLWTEKWWKLLVTVFLIAIPRFSMQAFRDPHPSLLVPRLYSYRTAHHLHLQACRLRKRQPSLRRKHRHHLRRRILALPKAQVQTLDAPSASMRLSFL